MPATEILIKFRLQTCEKEGTRFSGAERRSPCKQVIRLTLSAYPETIFLPDIPESCELGYLVMLKK